MPSLTLNTLSRLFYTKVYILTLILDTRKIEFLKEVRSQNCKERTGDLTSHRFDTTAPVFPPEARPSPADTRIHAFSLLGYLTLASRDQQLWGRWGSFRSFSALCL